MKILYHFLSTICILVFFIWKSSAFVGEDLWFDIYTSIDKWIKELQQIQYDYELNNQWSWEIFEVVNQILHREWLECQVQSSDDIAILTWNTSESTMQAIFEFCWWWQERLSIVFAENVQNALRDIWRIFWDRAEKKAEITYTLARIWLFADGNINNSPFDLIVDLQEIDTIIYGQKIEYNGITPIDNQSFQNFIDKIVNRSTQSSDTSKENQSIGTHSNPDEIMNQLIDGEGNNIAALLELIELIANQELDNQNLFVTDQVFIPEHWQICSVNNNSWLDSNIVADISTRFNPIKQWIYTPLRPGTFYYPESIHNNFDALKWPLKSDWPKWSFTSTKAPWPCNDTFCINIDFETREYGLIGWETRSIYKILSMVADHCEKPANASLTQRKQAINNFEISSIIRDLPSMLRWVSLEVSSKPLPILAKIEHDEDPTRDEIEQEVKNMLYERYKWLWLDYDRQNDIEIADKSPIVQKILQTSPNMSLVYPERRFNEFKSYDTAFINAFQRGQNHDTHIINQKQLQWFVNNFNELERFTFSFTDYIKDFTWIIMMLEEIPTRTP